MKGPKRIAESNTTIIKRDITKDASSRPRVDLAQIQILFDVIGSFSFSLLIQLRSFDLVEPIVVLGEKGLHVLILTMFKGQLEAIVLMTPSEFEVPPILQTPSLAGLLLLFFLVEEYSSCD